MLSTKNLYVDLLDDLEYIRAHILGGVRVRKWGNDVHLHPSNLVGCRCSSSRERRRLLIKQNNLLFYLSKNIEYNSTLPTFPCTRNVESLRTFSFRALDR